MKKTVVNLTGSYWLVTASAGPKADQCVRSAAIYARVSGSIGSTYTDGDSSATIERVELKELS